MPKYKITSPSGNTVIISGDAPPTQEDADSIFESLNVSNSVSNQKTEIQTNKPPTRDEIEAQVRLDMEKDISDQAGDFFNGVGKGILQMARMGVGASSEAISALANGEFSKVAKSIPEGAAKAIFDIGELGEGISGRVSDLYADTDEELIRRRVDRAMKDIDDNKRRQEGFFFGQDETLPQLTEVASIVADPTNLLGIGVAGKLGKAASIGSKSQKAANILNIPSDLTRRGIKKGIKATARLGSKVLPIADKPLKILSKTADTLEQGISYPRRAMTDLVSKSIGATPSQVEGLRKFGKFGGVFAPGVGILNKAELAAGAVKKTADIAQDAKTVLAVLGDSNRQARFLEALYMSPGVPKYVKKAISVAGTGGEKALDIAFNSVANGVSTGTLQGILAAMATTDAEAIGQAVGGGLALGAAVPIGQVPGVDPNRASKALLNTIGGQKSAIASTPITPDTPITATTPRANVSPIAAGAVNPNMARDGMITPQSVAFTPTTSKPFSTFKVQKPATLNGVEQFVDINTADKARQSFLTRKAQLEQATLASGLQPQDKSTLAMLAKNGSDADIRLLDKSIFKNTHKAEFGENPNGKPFFEDENGTIWVDSSAKNITPHLIETITARTSKDYIQTKADVVKDIAGDYTSSNGKELPISSQNPDAGSMKIGGDLLKEVDAYNAAAPDGAKIIDLNGAVSRFLEVRIDSLFNENNAKVLKSLQGKPSTKQALNDVSNSAMGKLGLIGVDGQVVKIKDMPDVVKAIGLNRSIKRATTNIDRVKKSIEKDSVKELSDKQKRVDALQKRVDKQKSVIQKAQNKKVKEEVKAQKPIDKANDNKLSSLVSKEEARQKPKSPERKAFFEEKKALGREIPNIKYSPTDAKVGAGNEGITMPDKVKEFYSSVLKDPDAVKHIETIEGLIASGSDAVVSGAITAALKSRDKTKAQQGLKNIVEEKKWGFAPFDIQIPQPLRSNKKSPSTNTTISNVRGFDLDKIRAVSGSDNIPVADLLKDITFIRNYIKSGGKYNSDKIKDMKNYDSIKKALTQYEFRNIASIQPL